MYCAVMDAKYEDGNTSDLVLDCGGGVVSFTESFVYLGSLLHCNLSDDHTTSTKASRNLPRRSERFATASSATRMAEWQGARRQHSCAPLSGCES